VLGASDAMDAVRVIEGGMTYGILSMESYGFGFATDQAIHAATRSPEAVIG
jgi:hypothetical protein